MVSAFSNVGLFLIEMIFSLFTYTVLLRFFLQLVKADFYNPFCQLSILITNPLLKPMRRFIPSFFGLDCAALLLAYLTVLMQLVLEKFFLSGTLLIIWTWLLLSSLIKLILAIIWLYILLIFI